MRARRHVLRFHVVRPRDAKEVGDVCAQASSKRRNFALGDLLLEV